MGFVVNLPPGGGQDWRLVLHDKGLVMAVHPGLDEGTSCLPKADPATPADTWMCCQVAGEKTALAEWASLRVVMS